MRTSREPSRRYIVICAQIVGGEGRHFETVYNWDRERFSDRQSAIAHGFRIRGSDDFNVALLEGDRLIEIGWMDHPMHLSDADHLPNIAAQIGVSAPGSAR